MRQSYLADYHTHSRWSFDASHPMGEMALAGADAGLREICFTDHVELYNPGDCPRSTFDWGARSAEFTAARAEAGGRIVIRQGIELGEAPRDFAWAAQVLDTMPEPDFIIGSIHQFSEKFHRADLYYDSSTDPKVAETQITDYLNRVLQLASWGKFSVLGHLTLPLRYMNEDRGMHMSFDGREGEIREIFRALIANGCGIEINTNRGNAPLPGARWAALYRALGGEIITLGSDAHTPEFVGRGIAEGQRMLRECGFTQFCTFEKGKPIFHDLL